MKSESVHTLILGAGPSGLSAGYVLAKAGLKPLLLERDRFSGGLMRSLKHKDFTIDVGRKELYNRLEKVDTFWNELLGADYREYPHRGGILYKGVIFDQSPAFQGARRGMPLGMFLGCVYDFAKAQVFRNGTHPRNVEEYFYQKRGRRTTRVFSQAFQEKLMGRRWAEIPMPANQTNGDDRNLAATLKAAFERTFSKKEVNTYKGIWRHPALGTGQIMDALVEGINKHGGRIVNSAKLLGITTGPKGVETVTVEVGGEVIEYKPQHLVSSIPLEVLAQVVLGKKPDPKKSSVFRKRTSILVYLFQNGASMFPQAWLNVTCPDTRIGRITNYSNFNGRMVPEGKSCICCEYFCYDEEPLIQESDAQFIEKTIDYCHRSKLVDRTKVFDTLVLRLPGADASQNRDNWMNQTRMGLLEELKPFTNLYFVARTETDFASLAGMEAAEAILSGQRADFDRRIDPAELGLRSEPKAFEFKCPVPIG
jgi:protoporphyrinogen oxidase